jgi:hypothetical protein
MKHLHIRVFECGCIFLFLMSGKGSVLNSDNDTTKLFLKFHETPCRYVAIFEEWSIFQVQ